MRIQNLLDIFSLVDELYQYLVSREIKFNKDGYPEFTREMFLDEWPDLVIPFSQRKNKIVVNRQKTLICHFDRDQRLYPRLSKLLNEIAEYKLFMGVVGLDITITEDMDQEWQEAIALLNQLYLAVLAVNGIKIVMNTRSAGVDGSTLFSGVPSGVMAASGFLGCSRLENEMDYSYLTKVLSLLPDKLILYGKHDKIVENQLDVIGIDYRVYMDFHRMCQEVSNG